MGAKPSDQLRAKYPFHALNVLDKADDHEDHSQHQEHEKQRSANACAHAGDAASAQDVGKYCDDKKYNRQRK
jgi:hypothetical protein